MHHSRHTCHTDDMYACMYLSKRKRKSFDLNLLSSSRWGWRSVPSGLWSDVCGEQNTSVHALHTDWVIETKQCGGVVSSNKYLMYVLYSACTHIKRAKGRSFSVAIAMSSSLMPISQLLRAFLIAGFSNRRGLVRSVWLSSGFETEELLEILVACGLCFFLSSNCTQTLDMT